MDTESTSESPPGSDTLAATAVPVAPDINHPDNYINREISLIEFNRRVLRKLSTKPCDYSNGCAF